MQYFSMGDIAFTDQIVQVPGVYCGIMRATIMFIRKNRLVFALLIIMWPFVNGCSEQNQATMNKEKPKFEDTASLDPIITDVIIRYVAEAKKWNRDLFRIRFQGTVSESDIEGEGISRQGKAEYQRYLILHVDDVETPKPGGGRSFFADFDPSARKIVREMHFE